MEKSDVYTWIKPDQALNQALNQTLNQALNTEVSALGYLRALMASEYCHGKMLLKPAPDLQC